MFKMRKLFQMAEKFHKKHMLSEKNFALGVSHKWCFADICYFLDSVNACSSGLHLILYTE